MRKTLTAALFAGALLVASAAYADDVPPASADAPSEIAVHAFSMRVGYGLLGPMFSLSTITLQWDRIYWDMLRGAFAVGFYNGSFLGAVETSAGVRFRFGTKNELRLGLGLAYGVMTNDTYGRSCRTTSGDSFPSAAPPHRECFAGDSQGLILPVEAYYLRRIARHFSFQTGVVVHVSIVDLRRDRPDDDYPYPDAALFVGVVF